MAQEARGSLAVEWQEAEQSMKGEPPHSQWWYLAHWHFAKLAMNQWSVIHNSPCAGNKVWVLWGFALLLFS